MRTRLCSARPAPRRPDPGAGTPPRPRDRRGRRRTERGRRPAPWPATGLLAGALALLGLAAAPGGEIATVAGDRVEERVSDVAAGLLADAVFVVGDPERAAPDEATGGDDERPVRTVAASPSPAHPVVHERPAGDGDPEAEDAEPPEDGPEGDADAADDQPAAGTPTVWDRLADCESGDRDPEGRPRPGTARWDYGLEFAHDGYEQFQGGLNFTAGTWDAFRDPDMPEHAGRASREQEIAVAERVLEAQGWAAWPVCSEMIGQR